ncbi:MAG: hypothetical protein IKF01_00895 [Bacilli bacterium]|nr:hypothetical protein [Bacilli bacterium]
MKIDKVIEFYILKFIKIGNMGFFKNLDLEKINILNIKKDVYYFSYEEGYSENNIKNYSFIMGIIDHYEIKISVYKIIKTTINDEDVSFITSKNGEFKLVDDKVVYDEHYCTTKKTNENEKYSESINRIQNYDFKNGIKDFITNYKNLVPKKWPIIKNIDEKKLIKKC